MHLRLDMMGSCSKEEDGFAGFETASQRTKIGLQVRVKRKKKKG